MQGTGIRDQFEGSRTKLGAPSIRRSLSDGWGTNLNRLRKGTASAVPHKADLLVLKGTGMDVRALAPEGAFDLKRAESYEAGS
jgi:hypothetical protein